MLALVENEFWRCLRHVTRSRLRSPSHCRSRLFKQNYSRSPPCGPQRRWTCSLVKKKSIASSSLETVAQQVLSSAAQSFLPNFIRRYISGKPYKKPETEPDIKRVQAFFSAKQFEEIPGPTATLHAIPFAGTRLLYYPFTDFSMEDMGNMLSKLQATYGPILRVRIGLDWLVLVEDLTDIEQVVKASENEAGLQFMPFQDGGLANLPRRVGDSALSWLDGSRMSHRVRLAIARQLNNNAVVAKHLCTQEKIAEELVKNLEQMQESSHEVQILCYRYALESAGHMCFNQRLGLLNEHYFCDVERQKLVDSYRTVVRSLGESQTGGRMLYLLFDDPFTKRFREASSVVQTWERKLVRAATMAAIKLRDAPSPGQDSRSLLIDLMDDKSLGESEIYDAVHTLMTTGTDLVASTLQMLLFSLATNLDKQEKLADHVLRVLGPDGPLSLCALDTLDYLKAAVKESIRLHFPLSAGGGVMLSRNIVLSNYIIPSGTQIVVNSRRTAKNPAFFEHPNLFNPERWLDESAKDIPTLAFMPFGFGLKQCPSRAFSLQELYTAIAKILQKFKLEVPCEYQSGQVETVYTPFRSPKKPIPFIFTRRQENPPCKALPSK